MIAHLQKILDFQCTICNVTQYSFLVNNYPRFRETDVFICCNSEEKRIRFLRNFGNYLPNNTVQNPPQLKCSYLLPQVFQMSQQSVTFVANLVDWLQTLSQLYSLQFSQREWHDDNNEKWNWKRLLYYFKCPKKNIYAICSSYRERTFHVGSKLCQFYVKL